MTDMNWEFPHAKCTCNEEKSKPLFSIGDKVYSSINGWGVVVGFNFGMIKVSPDRGGSTWNYRPDGSFCVDGDVTLFHDQPTVIAPKKKIKKWRWAYRHAGKDLITYSYKSEEEMKIWDKTINPAVKLPWTEIEE